MKARELTFPAYDPREAGLGRRCGLRVMVPVHWLGTTGRSRRRGVVAASCQVVGANPGDGTSRESRALVAGEDRAQSEASHASASRLLVNRRRRSPAYAGSVNSGSFGRRRRPWVVSTYHVSESRPTKPCHPSRLLPQSNSRRQARPSVRRTVRQRHVPSGRSPFDRPTKVLDAAPTRSLRLETDRRGPATAGRSP